jgi:DUF1707 SHOCT-like domain
MDSTGANDTREAAQPIDRESANRELAHIATSGGMTLGEYAERASAIGEAATAEEIRAVVEGLPDEAAAPTPARHPRWIVAVFGGTRQRGRWLLSKRLWLLAALGGANLDLAAAEFEAPESVITAVVVLGGAVLLVPQGVPIQLSGFSLFGGKADRRPAGPALQGSPLVRVRAFTFFGGVAVKESPGRRTLLDIISSPRKQPTSS